MPSKPKDKASSISSLGRPESGRPIVLRFLNTEGTLLYQRGREMGSCQNEYAHNLMDMRGTQKYAQLRDIFEAVAF